MIKSHFKKFATLSLSAALFAGIGITASASATTSSLKSQTIAIASSVSLTGTAGTPVNLSSSGSTGTGTISYATKTHNCYVGSNGASATQVIATVAATTCSVTASIAADSTNAAATSTAVNIVFAGAQQAGFYVENGGSVGKAPNATPTPFANDASLKGVWLAGSTGGSGSGKVTYATSTTGCSVTANKLTTTSTTPIVCSITATKAGSGKYAAITSPALSVQFQNIAYAAHLTSITGLLTGTKTLNYAGDYASGGDTWFLNQYYSSLDNWLLNYVAAGSTVSETWTVTGSDGKPAANLPVTFEGAVANGNLGGNWDGFGMSLDTSFGVDKSTNGFRMTGYTNNKGQVTFTFNNTDTATGLNPNDTTTAAGANVNLGSYPWSRGALIVGRPSKLVGTNGSITSQGWTDGKTYTWDAGGLGASGTTQVTDLVDLIVVPGASAKTAQLPVSISNTSTSAANGASITLTATGGSGSGSVTFAATGTGCTLAGNSLSVTNGASSICHVTATKAGDSTYGAATSSSVDFGFGSVDTPSALTPDTVTVAVTSNNSGLLNANAIPNTNGWFSPVGFGWLAASGWNYHFVHAGANLTFTYTVTGSNGNPLVGVPVKMIESFNGANNAMNYTLTGATANDTLDTYGNPSMLTDSNGQAIFTVTVAPTVAATTAPTALDANNGQSLDPANPFSHVALQVGNDVLAGAGVNEVFTLSDIIVVPDSYTGA